MLCAPMGAAWGTHRLYTEEGPAWTVCLLGSPPLFTQLPWPRRRGGPPLPLWWPHAVPLPLSHMCQTLQFPAPCSRLLSCSLTTAHEGPPDTVPEITKSQFHFSRKQGRLHIKQVEPKKDRETKQMSFHIQCDRRVTAGHSYHVHGEMDCQPCMWPPSKG